MGLLTKKHLLLFGILFALFISEGLLAEQQPPARDDLWAQANDELFLRGIKQGERIRFTMTDGVRLQGLLFRAQEDKKVTNPTPRPLIIMVNSWTLNEKQYLLPALKLSQKGFHVLSYSARGWGDSEGEVRVASPEDISDLSQILDILKKHLSYQEESVGLLGISYGGGISLLASAFDARIAAVVAMSSWTDLEDSLFPGETANELWSRLLITSGKWTGRISNEVRVQIDNLLNYKNTPELKAWARPRSPFTWIEKTNQNKTAILLIQNWSDGLFNPNSIISYFKKLKNTKKLILQEGIHGVSEGGSLVGVDLTESFNEAENWFSEHLQNPTAKQQGIPRAQFITEVRNTGQMEEHYENLWAQQQNLQETPRSQEKFYFNIHEKTMHQKGPAPGALNFSSSLRSLASTGFPIFSSLLESYFKLPIKTLWPLLARTSPLSFISLPLEHNLKIRGSMRLSVKARLKEASQPETVSLFAYIYSVADWGKAKLISHAPVSLLLPAEQNPKQEGSFIKADFQFIATAFNLNQQDKLALVIDARDPIYKERQQKEFELEMDFSSAELVVPTAFGP